LGIVDVPMYRGGSTVGSVSVWQSNLWIDDFDRVAAIVSVGLGILLVGFGVLLARRVVATALAPLQSIASLAEQIEGHDLSLRLRADDPTSSGACALRSIACSTGYKRLSIANGASSPTLRTNCERR
jgi:hypothetical protein